MKNTIDVFLLESRPQNVKADSRDVQRVAKSSPDTEAPSNGMSMNNVRQEV